MRLAIILLALTLPASAQVYKWTDENGRTVFGQRPPPSGAEHVPIGETNGALPPAEAYRSRPQQRPAPRSSSRDSSSMCDYAKSRIRRLNARWEDVKSQGYTVADQNSYNRQIAEARRYKDENC